MEQTSIPHLCGGIFFALVLQARRQRKKAKDKLKGGTDSLTDKDVFAGLTKVLTGEEISVAGRTLAKCASLYKTCQNCTGVYVPFSDPPTVSAFDSLFKTKNPVIYNRMTEFVETYLNQEKCEWLVRVLIDTIQQDICISENVSFDIDYSQSLKKKDLDRTGGVILQAFLVSVLHYIVMHAPDAESGRSTFETWFTQSGNRTEWKYNGNVGDKIHPMNIQLADYKPETHRGAFSGDDESTSESIKGVPLVIQSIVPDLSESLNSSIYMVDDDLLEDDVETKPEEKIRPFKKYIDGAFDFFKDKKTLLNPEEPRPFYNFYVCNDLKYHKQRYGSERDTKPEVIISDGIVRKLEAYSKYIIIEGTGGIGKSMYLTHLFLTAATEYQESGILPIFASLKDYKESTLNILDFLLTEVRSYDSSVTQKEIIESLERKQTVLLFDGMDEIQTSVRDNFFTDLEAFIKSYFGNTVIITSRPVYDFVSYARFSVFDIQPFTKEQALALIRKLDFWDEEGKQNFIQALDLHLFISHWQFASNPLLLTIMLMTFSAFGEVPGKMHVFYAKAYETMARLHDATKGSFKRPLYTSLTPEDFAQYFAEFCARTYVEEKLDFDEQLFSQYMGKVLKDTPAKAMGVTPRKFLKDLTDNLCIMYKEGPRYYFIHRSFQEYFAAFHFAYGFEFKLTQLGEFFDEGPHRSYSDRTFDMLYDMVSEKVEQLIFYPTLKKFVERWNENGKTKEYWKFLSEQYPMISVEEGETDSAVINFPQSYIYGKITQTQKIDEYYDLDEVEWPEQIHEMKKESFYKVYQEFLDLDSFDEYPDADSIPEEVLCEKTIVVESGIPHRYYSYFGEPEQCGCVIEIDTEDLLNNPGRYKQLIALFEDEEFPLKKEFLRVKQYYSDLAARIEKNKKSSRLFSD